MNERIKMNKEQHTKIRKEIIEKEAGALLYDVEAQFLGHIYDYKKKELKTLSQAEECALYALHNKVYN